MEVFGRFKDLADKKKEIFDEDIIALVDDQVLRGSDKIKFVSLIANAGSLKKHEAKLVLEVEGVKKESDSSGDGPVDATFNAIKKIIKHKARLKLYQINAITAGTDAQGEVTVRLEEKGLTVQAKGFDTDIVVASAKAYVNAINKLMIKRNKSAPDEISNIKIIGV